MLAEGGALTDLIRFSIIDYLNSLPLTMAFKDGRFSERASIIFDFPSMCADNLASGRADVGLISSIEYERIPGLVIAPQICIASKEEVRSVLILTTKPLSEVKTIALDRYSRSSVALLRILLHRRYGMRPHFISMTPSATNMLAEADAALIIGDAALNLEPGNYEVIDLAQEWFRETGLPAVFAFWAMRDSVDLSVVTEMLLEAKAYGLSQIEARMDDIQARWQLDADDVRRYFRDNIHFDLGERELKSLETFYRYAHEAHLIPEIVKPRFVSLG